MVSWSRFPLVPWRNSSSSRMLPIIDGIAIHRNGAYGVVVLALWLLHGRLAAGSGWRARRQRVAATRRVRLARVPSAAVVLRLATSETRTTSSGEMRLARWDGGLLGVERGVVWINHTRTRKKGWQLEVSSVCLVRQRQPTCSTNSSGRDGEAR